MSMIWIVIGMVSAGFGTCTGWTQQIEPPKQLIREVVYNELRDHDTHGFWRYWVQQKAQNETRLVEEVETSAGPIKHLLRTNGHPPDKERRQEEQARLAKLVTSPREQASNRQAYQESEKHIAVVLQMLPDAFVFEDAGIENNCRHLRYRPDPAYTPHTIEQRIIHSLEGEVWIETSAKRLSRLDGRFADNVDFGFGLLGRLDKGGWFGMQRIQVSPTEWKTDKLEVHVSGRAVIFKCIERETSEVRGGFVALPSGITVAQGMKILQQTDPHSPPTTAMVTPVSITGSR